MSWVGWRLMLIAMAVVLARADAAETFSIEQYGLILQRLDRSLAIVNEPMIASGSSQLQQVHIRWHDEVLSADPVLLQVIHAHHYAQARRMLAQLLPALSLASHQDEVLHADHQALQGLVDHQQQRQVEQQGELDGLPLVKPELSDKTLDRLEALRDWVAKKWEELGDLLHKWFGHESTPGTKQANGHLTLLVVIVIAVIAIGFGILAYLQRQSVLQAVALPVRKSPHEDADPRSRASLEWQRYAEQLFAAGRWREAVRAWYHAVLVQCWSSGLIRHRQGWTNWEYASHLPSGWSHRVAFVDLTARFDRSWYGSISGREDAEVFAQQASTLYQSLITARS